MGFGPLCFLLLGFWGLGLALVSEKDSMRATLRV